MLLLVLLPAHSATDMGLNGFGLPPGPGFFPTAMRSVEMSRSRRSLPFCTARIRDSGSDVLNGVSLFVRSKMRL